MKSPRIPPKWPASRSMASSWTCRSSSARSRNAGWIFPSCWRPPAASRSTKATPTPARPPAQSPFSTATAASSAIAATPIEDLAANCDFLEVAYLLIYGELPTAQQLQRLPRHRSCGTRCCTRTCGSSTAASRATPIRWRSSSAVGQRPLDLLSGLARPARSAAGRNFDPPPARQAADDRRLQLQEVDRPAVHLSAERPVVLRELPADDVRRAERAV